MTPTVEDVTETTRIISDQFIASDLNQAVKEGIRNYANALTETASPKAREILLQQFQDSVEAHARIIGFMMERGWYRPGDIREQMKMDCQVAEIALGLKE